MIISCPSLSSFVVITLLLIQLSVASSDEHRLQRRSRLKQAEYEKAERELKKIHEQERQDVKSQLEEETSHFLESLEGAFDPAKRPAGTDDKFYRNTRADLISHAVDEDKRMRKSMLRHVESDMRTEADNFRKTRKWDALSLKNRQRIKDPPEWSQDRLRTSQARLQLQHAQSLDLVTKQFQAKRKYHKNVFGNLQGIAQLFPMGQAMLSPTHVKEQEMVQEKYLNENEHRIIEEKKIAHARELLQHDRDGPEYLSKARQNQLLAIGPNAVADFMRQQKQESSTTPSQHASAAAAGITDIIRAMDGLQMQSSSDAASVDQQRKPKKGKGGKSRKGKRS